jgi:hypothetical protein
MEKVRARVVEHPSPRGRRAPTRPPMVNVSPVAACVQPLREERRRFGRSVRSLPGLQGGRRVLRGLRLGSGPVRLVRQGSAARDPSGRQPSVGAVPDGARVGPPPSGGVPSAAASRNGPALDGSSGVIDVSAVAELRGGAGAQGASRPCPDIGRHSRHLRAALRRLPPRSLRARAPERAPPPASARRSAPPPQGPVRSHERAAAAGHR